MFRCLRAASFALLLVTGWGAVHAQGPITIGASPSKFDLEIGGRPVTDALRVFNFGSVPARIDVTVSSWTLDAAGEVKLLPPDEQSLDQWMIINPVSFEIPPGSFQTVRFAIRPRVEPEPGEHRAMIFLTQQPLARREDTTALQVVGRLGIAVYGYAGEIRRTGELNEVRIDTAGERPRAAFDISSIGTAHVRMSGHYTIWPSGRYPGSEATEPIDPAKTRALETPDGAVGIGWLPITPVLPETRRWLPLQFNPGLPPGDYVLDLQGDLSGSPIDVGIPFSVSEPPAEKEHVVSN